MNRINTDKIARYFGNLRGKITLGIDGYIDEVYQIVDTRISLTEYTVFSKMGRFAERILACGGGGLGNEIVRKRRSFGGFTANTGNAAARLGVDTVMLALYGKERLDPVFECFGKMCKVISIGEPALSHIYEFDDGKLMLPYIADIMNFDWETLTGALSVEELKAIFNDSDVIAIGYWSGMPAFDEIVTNLCEQVIADGQNKRMFFDFADTKKRDKKSLRDTLTVLARLNGIIPMTLSMNEHESADVFRFFGEDFSYEDPGNICDIIERVRLKTGLDELVVHTPRYAAAASAREGAAAVPQEYCVNPVRTTGAGDTFNGGYMSACLKDLSAAERLAAANCATGFFIRNGYAPDRHEIAAEVRRVYG